MRHTDVMVRQTEADLAQVTMMVRALRTRPAHLGDEAGVVRVKVLIDFVEVVEWTWIVILDGKDQRQRRHGLFASRKAAATAAGLSTGPSPHVQASRKRLLGVLEEEFTFAAFGEGLVDPLEVLVDLRKHLRQANSALLIQLFRQIQQS